MLSTLPKPIDAFVILAAAVCAAVAVDWTVLNVVARDVPFKIILGVLIPPFVWVKVGV